MKYLLNHISVTAILSLIPTYAIIAQEIPTEKYQINLASKAAPDGLGEQAMVLGYNTSGKLITLREGSNNLVCLADDPKVEGISVACYHKDLEPFMQRGRELKAEGKGMEEIFNTREEEAKAGTLQMPENPAALYVLSGNEAQYFSETDSLAGASLRYVVYIPFATAESTGLPLKPSVPGEPWIMNPGTHRAHIMITPPSN